jgi:hypothetical protein
MLTGNVKSRSSRRVVDFSSSITPNYLSCLILLVGGKAFILYLKGRLFRILGQRFKVLTWQSSFPHFIGMGQWLTVKTDKWKAFIHSFISFVHWFTHSFIRNWLTQ